MKGDNPGSALDTQPPTRASYFLQPGELWVPVEPTAVKTLLGSCVSVCLWDNRRCAGGVTHFLLPQGRATPDRPARYGNLALPMLIDRMLRAGSQREHLRAKVFGGAAMLANPRPDHIGAQNSAFALSWLETQRIAVVACDTGGARGRKLIFNTDDADVSLWEL